MTYTGRFKGRIRGWEGVREGMPRRIGRALRPGIALLLGAAFLVSCASNIVIGHRGLPYWAPEETRPSYLLSRELGVDYLEADIQRTSDGVLVCWHDKNLNEKTSVAEVFPTRRLDSVNTFTLAELKELDAGSRFNSKYPGRARSSYAGQQILTLDELIDIAEGGKSPVGLCLETKEAHLFPGIEQDLHRVLTGRGWDGSDSTRKLLLQTFEKSSLSHLNHYFPGVPKILLLWEGENRMQNADRETYGEWVDFGKANGAQFIGPSIPGPPNNFADLMQDWMVELIHDKDLGIAPYTVNTPVEFEAYAGKSEGLFTDRADLLLDYHGRPREDMKTLFKRLGL